jgi:Adaptin N terminal region.
MLGHDTEFGQIECLKLITSQNYSDKKVGYLGLTQLFNEKSEVLMMATHRMRSDLQSSVSFHLLNDQLARLIMLSLLP